MENKNVTVGLFGTCDNSTWRDDFITVYDNIGVNYFNPDAGDDWHPGLVERENNHLLSDDIILFPVLNESLGLGSLAEIGFSVLNSIQNIKNGSGQYLITMIDDDCTDERKTKTERDHSISVRRFVKSKLLDVRHPNIMVVNDLYSMKSLSIELINAIEITKQARHAYAITKSAW